MRKKEVAKKMVDSAHRKLGDKHFEVRRKILHESRLEANREHSSLMNKKTNPGKGM